MDNSMKFCSRCGATRKDQAVFCDNCGCKLDTEPSVFQKADKFSILSLVFAGIAFISSVVSVEKLSLFNDGKFTQSIAPIIIFALLGAAFAALGMVFYSVYVKKHGAYHVTSKIGKIASMILLIYSLCALMFSVLLFMTVKK